MTLHCKDILVTGATGVIGRAIARHLAQSGCRVHLAGRDGKRLASLQRELLSAGMKSPLYRLNLRDLASCQKAVKDFFSRANAPYGMVCNAGHLGPVGPFWKIPMHAWRHSVNENFLAHATMIHAFSRAMAGQRRPEGSIIVLSGAGVGGAGDFSGVTSYSTSKAALVHLVEALAQEFKPLHLTINAVAPGAVRSSMTEQARRGGKREPKRFVSPDQAARLVEFLMSENARAITGRLLSARYDQDAVRRKTGAIARDAHCYRLRRIDYALFSPRESA